MEIQGRLRFTPLIVFVFPCVVFWQNKTNSQPDPTGLCVHHHPLMRDLFFLLRPQRSAQERHKKKQKKKGETPIALYRLRWTSFFSHLLKSLYPWNFEVQPAKGFEKACNLPTMTRQRISQALQDRVERGRKRAGGGVAPFFHEGSVCASSSPSGQSCGGLTSY